LNGITRHAIFEIPKDIRKPAKNKKLSASDKFYEAIYEGPTLSCTSCNKLYYTTTIKTYDIQDSWRSILSTLLSPQNTAGLFCDRCIKCLKQKKMPPLCVLNNLQVVKIPDVLKKLNIAEQKMISMAHAYMKVVILPYGQKAINGQVINFPYDVQEEIGNFLIGDWFWLELQDKRNIL
jgi:hypothetical protein